MRKVSDIIDIDSSSIITQVLSEARAAKRSYKWDSTPKVLRPYQNECMKSTLEHLRHNLIAINELCTGSGKTLILKMTLLAYLRKHKGRALVISHNEDLLFNFRDEFTEEECQTDMYPVFRSDPVDDSRIHMETIQGLYSMKRLNPAAYRRLIDKYIILGIDEVHHYPAQDQAAWTSVVNDFKACRKQVVSMTATAFRNDRDFILIPNHEDHVTYQYGIEQGVWDGYLCEVYGVMVCSDVVPDKEAWDKNDLKLRFSHVKFQQRAAVLESRLKQVETEMGRRMQTIIFTTRIHDCYKIKEILDKNGNLGRVEVVDGSQKSSYRNEIYEQFRQNKVNIIINVKVVSEGVNLPNCDVVVMANPTKSKGFYLQMLGRGTRHPFLKTDPKKFLLVIDFVDNITSNHLSKIVTCGRIVQEGLVSGGIFTQRHNHVGRITHMTEDRLKLYAKRYAQPPIGLDLLMDFASTLKTEGHLQGNCVQHLRKWKELDKSGKLFKMLLDHSRRVDKSGKLSQRLTDYAEVHNGNVERS